MAAQFCAGDGAGDGAVITGTAALRRHGLLAGAPAAGDITVTDVLMPYARRRVSSSLVQVHRTTRMPRRWLADGPLRYALPARAVADAARGLRQPRDVPAVAAAAAGWGLCTLAEIAAELAEGPRRNTARLRAALAGLAPRAPARDPERQPGAPAGL